MNSGYTLPKEIRHRITWNKDHPTPLRIPSEPTCFFVLANAFLDPNNRDKLRTHNPTEALNYYFYDQEPVTDEEGNVIKTKTISTLLTLEKPPEDFGISIDITTGSGEKIEANLEGAMKVSLGVQFGPGADYFCDGFIRHDGVSSNGGHYIAYLYKNGVWWEADDQKKPIVSQIDLKDVESNLSKASFIHYTKAT